MVIDTIRKMSVKGVKLKSESYFSISPGTLELWRKTLEGRIAPPPPPPPGPDRVKATVSNRVEPDYLFIRTVFCSFLFLSARFLCSLAGYAEKHVLDIVGLSQSEV